MNRFAIVKKIKLKEQLGGRINMQMIGGLVTMILLLVLVIFLLNRLFLSEFYLREKQQTLKNSYEQLNKAAASLQLYQEDYRYTMERLCANDNLSIVVIAPNGRVLIASESDTSVMLDQLYGAIFKDEGKIIDTTDFYTLRLQNNAKMKEDYLLLIGSLSDGNMILIRTAVQSMEDAAKVSGRFLLYAALVVCFVGIVYATVFTKKMMEPVHEMNRLAKRMASLDFEASYRTREHPNELDELGEHLNDLSGALEKNIAKLKKANADLRADLKIREENEKMRQEFLSNVSHELKTPLALILGYAEGLVSDVSEDKEERRQYCEVIIDETQKMSRLVSELLTLNELEFSVSDYQPERFDIVEMIYGFLQANQILFDQNGIGISFLNKTPIYVWGDVFRVEQVLTNYLSNAVHYAAGDKHIDIRVEENEAEVCVHVFNSGEPIDEDKLPYIWDKFYKADEARSREYGGSGIGLSVVKAIMESMGKSYGADNYDNGVDFWFTLDR